LDSDSTPTPNNFTSTPVLAKILNFNSCLAHWNSLIITKSTDLFIKLNSSLATLLPPDLATLLPPDLATVLPPDLATLLSPDLATLLRFYEKNRKSYSTTVLTKNAKLRLHSCSSCRSHLTVSMVLKYFWSQYAGT